MICGSRGSKGRLAKAAGAEPCGQMRDEKLHAAVARSTFASEKAKSTSRSEHFWKLRCRKSARRCGAKHIPKSKHTKHTNVGALLEKRCRKKCMLLQREAHLQAKSTKNWRVRSTFGRSDVVLRGRRKEFCTLPKVSKKAWGFVAVSTTITALHYTTHYNTLLQLKLQLQLQLQLHYTKLHYANYITLNYTTLQSTPLHYTQLHFTSLHYATLHYTALHYTYTTLHYTALHYTTPTLRYTTLHYTTLRYTQLHYTTLRYATLH